MDDLEHTLTERGRTHGDYQEQARITRQLQRVIRSEDTMLTDGQAVALDMICHKIGRILVGDPSVIDHWQDIAGYATLCARELHNTI